MVYASICEGVRDACPLVVGDMFLWLCCFVGKTDMYVCGDETLALWMHWRFRPTSTSIGDVPDFGGFFDQGEIEAA